MYIVAQARAEKISFINIIKVFWEVKEMEAVKRFLKDERGLETVEYAIILGLIVAATITLVVTLGKWVGGQFQAVVTTTSGQGAAPLP